MRMKECRLSKLLLLVLPAFAISLFPFATKSHPKQPEVMNATEDEVFDPTFVKNKSEGPSLTKSLITAKVFAASVGNDQMEVTEPEINNHVGPLDSYSMYKHLMEMKESLTGRKKEFKKEPELVKSVKEALATMFEVGVKAVLEGFFPHVHRQKRSAEGSKRTILEWFINLIGALLGKEECTKILACRTGKMVGSKVPGAGMAMLMLDGVVPKSLKAWFGVVKEAVIDRKDTCEEEYHCTLADEELKERIVLSPEIREGGTASAMEFLEQIRDASHNKSMSLTEILLEGFPELEEDFANFPVEEDIFAEDGNFSNSTLSLSSSLLSLSPETNNALRHFLELVDSSCPEELGMSWQWSEPSGESDLQLPGPPGRDESDLLPGLNNARNACVVLTSTLISLVETEYDADISSSSVEIDD